MAQAMAKFVVQFLAHWIYYVIKVLCTRITKQMAPDPHRNIVYLYVTYIERRRILLSVWNFWLNVAPSTCIL